jgi:chemotaxis protein histidine kinase CheA/CheY-like chemotaxis protein
MLSEQQQRIMGYFIEEAKDHLNTLEQGLLNLQATIADPELVSEVFRAAHSVKGGAAMLGLDSIQQTAHRLEDYFKILKECPIKVDQKLESLCLRVFDTLQELLEQLQGPFGLTDDKANEIMAEVEPVFGELGKHMSHLVSQSGSAPPEDVELVSHPAPAPTQTPITKIPAVNEEESALRLVFQSDVPTRLREMLQQFKQADTTESRRQLQETCQTLARMGEQFDLPAWCRLLETARRAIADSGNTYRTLAPVVIKDIKQAQELILAGRATDVTESEELNHLAPPLPIDSAVEIDFNDLLNFDLEDEADQPGLFDFTGDLDLEADQGLTLDFDDSSLDESSQDELSRTVADDNWLTDTTTPDHAPEPIDGLTSASPSEPGDVDFDHSAYTTADRVANRHGPEVGVAELNSLADLFEGEMPDLSITWQEEVNDESSDTLSESLDLESASDFSDLLFDQDSSLDLPLAIDDSDEDLSGLLHRSEFAGNPVPPSNQDLDHLFDLDFSDSDHSTPDDFSTLNPELGEIDFSEFTLTDALPDTALPDTALPDTGASLDLDILSDDLIPAITPPDRLSNFSDSFDDLNELFALDEDLKGTAIDSVSVDGEPDDLDLLFGGTEGTPSDHLEDRPVLAEAIEDDLFSNPETVGSIGDSGDSLPWSNADVVADLWEEGSDDANFDAFNLDAFNLDAVAAPSLGDNGDFLSFDPVNSAEALSLEEPESEAIAFSFEQDLPDLDPEDSQDFFALNPIQPDQDESIADNLDWMTDPFDHMDQAEAAIDQVNDQNQIEMERFGDADIFSSDQLIGFDQSTPSTKLQLSDDADIPGAGDEAPLMDLRLFGDEPSDEFITDGSGDQLDENLADLGDLFGEEMDGSEPEVNLYEFNPFTEVTGEQSELAGLSEIADADLEGLEGLFDFDQEAISDQLIGNELSADALSADTSVTNDFVTDSSVSDEFDWGVLPETSEATPEPSEAIAEGTNTNLDLDVTDDWFNETDETVATPALNHLEEDWLTSSEPISEPNPLEAIAAAINADLPLDLTDDWLSETTATSEPSATDADLSLDLADDWLSDTEETPALDDLGDDWLTSSEPISDFDSGLFDLSEAQPEVSLSDSLELMSAESALADLDAADLEPDLDFSLDLDDQPGLDLEPSLDFSLNLDDQPGLEPELAADSDFSFDLEALTDEETVDELQAIDEIDLLSLDQSPSPDLDANQAPDAEMAEMDFDLGDFDFGFDEAENEVENLDSLMLDSDLTEVSDRPSTAESLDSFSLEEFGFDADSDPVEAPNASGAFDFEPATAPTAEQWGDLDDLLGDNADAFDLLESDPITSASSSGDELNELDALWDQETPWNQETAPSSAAIESADSFDSDAFDLDDLLAEDEAFSAAFEAREPEGELAIDSDNSDDFGDLDALMNQEISFSTGSDLSAIDLDDSDDFGDLDALLDQQVSTASSLLDETELNGFADLDALLDGEISAADQSMFDQPSSDEIGDDFADLDALLLEESSPPVSSTPAPSSASTSASITSEFDDLERLLEDADQTLGGQPTARGVRRPSLTPKKRSPGVLSDQNMRVSVKNLDNLNNLVGELVVNRNSLEQTQERLRQFLDNLLYQVQQLSDVGQRMRDLYERSLLESSLLSSRRSYHLSSQIQDVATTQSNHSTGMSFDALEMDRFTGFHTLSQEMIELIVRVRESASDIDFVVDESDQITRMFQQVTTQLREGLTRSRMVPFDQTAARLPRAVRDISIKCGKQAELAIEGKETLIDKMILEQLYDPMTHLVNNAITHGIETPEERRAGGKKAMGRITVRAFHQGNQTVISVTDDGAGIDPENVKRKAIEKGLITAAEARDMTRLDVYDLLFHHGFSTRDKADDFAGRGVGMDVVRTSLNEIRGSINIDSAIGKGTTFTIRLPLTLSISKALCCISNRARIAFPMDGVEDMLDVPKERIQTNAEGMPSIQWRDALLPFQPLSELLKYSRSLGRGSVYGGNQEEDIISVVVLRSNAGSYLALQVDQVLGEQEIVIKQLEGPVPKPIGIAGATVLGDGRIMPIVDVLELIDLSLGRIRREPGSSLWEKGDSRSPVEVDTKTDPTVLIVDDSITVRELLSMTFSKIGYRVEQARDGQEAWEKLRAGLPCDIVFCDIEMPRMDGLELLSRIQKDNNLNHLPIAMLTSRGADRHRQMAVQLGAKGYFTKPYLEEALLDAAQRMLKGEVLVS